MNSPEIAFSKDLFWFKISGKANAIVASMIFSYIRQNDKDTKGRTNSKDHIWTYECAVKITKTVLMQYIGVSFQLEQTVKTGIGYLQKFPFAVTPIY